jgi:Tfp pilus assembly protein PilW
MTAASPARRPPRGVTLIELVVGMGISLLALGACVGALAASARLVAALGARAEVEDTAQLAAEAFRFDVRRAGFDPTASGVEGLAAALPDQLTLQADLEADGALDAGSEEVTRWLCATAPPRLSRVIGAQSLPVAAPVSRCGIRYFDASGGELLPGTGGLDAPGRARVRRIVLDFAVDPAIGGAPASRIVEVALRVAS